MIRTEHQLRFVIIGGDPLAGPRYMWWNFVATDRDRIKAAAARWEAGEFPVIAGESERLKMPSFLNLANTHPN